MRPGRDPQHDAADDRSTRRAPGQPVREVDHRSDGGSAARPGAGVRGPARRRPAGDRADDGSANDGAAATTWPVSDARSRRRRSPGRSSRRCRRPVDRRIPPTRSRTSTSSWSTRTSRRRPMILLVARREGRRHAQPPPRLGDRAQGAARVPPQPPGAGHHGGLPARVPRSSRSSRSSPRPRRHRARSATRTSCCTCSGSRSSSRRRSPPTRSRASASRPRWSRS